MSGVSYTKKSILQRYDTVPTTNSSNLVDSGHIKTYVDNADSNLDSKIESEVALVDSKVDAMINRVGNPFVFKGTVSTLANLPSSGNTINDTYFVESEGFTYTWNGTSWDKTSTDVNNQLAHDIATEYDETKADYKAGELVLYNNQVYIRKLDATSAEGTFVTSNWTATSLGSELYSESSKLKNSIATTNSFIASFIRRNVSSNYLDWSFGEGINPATGANISGSSLARTTYEIFPTSLQVFVMELDVPGYEYTIWSYRSQSINNASRSWTNGQYVTGKTLVLKQNNDSYIRIGVRKTDGTPMTTGESDTSSDEYIIKSSFSIYVLTDDKLILPGVPADGKATGDAIQAVLDKDVKDLHDIISVMLDVYPQWNFAYEVGNIASNGGQTDSTSFWRSTQTNRGTIQAGDLIISDMKYKFRAAIFTSRTITTSNFITWIGSEGYFTTEGRRYQGLTIPEEYVGKYLHIVVVKNLDSTDEDMYELNNHIKVIRTGSITTEDSLNKVNIETLSGNTNVSVTQNGDGTITAATISNGSYRSFAVRRSVSLKKNASYILRCKIENIVSSRPVCYFRFRGDISGPNHMYIGIGAMTAPGEYGTIYHATGYETSLDFFITGGTSSDCTVILSELMFAETNMSLPYIPFGTKKDVILPAIGVSSDTKNWGRSNAIMHALQYSHVEWTPVADMPSQFASKNYMFEANEKVMGVPYSSARGVDKLIGPQVSLHTFLSATKNPRSVIFTRYTTYSNSRSFYGTVCSAFVSHCYNQRVNYSTSALHNWDRLVQISMTELKEGDVLLADSHVIFVTGVLRDQFGRMINVAWSEAGDPTVKDTLSLNWSRFLRYIETSSFGIFVPYRYLDISSVDYVYEQESIGYPDETLEEITYPDIMSEYGDKAVLCEGEDTMINVIESSGYSRIVISIDGEQVDTRTTLVDFKLENLQPGLYEITMTGTENVSTTQFFVCQATCSFDGTILTFSSTNANVVAIYTYSDTEDFVTDGYVANHVVKFTQEDIENGRIDLSNDTHTSSGDRELPNAKVAFEPKEHPSWGVGTWYSKLPYDIGLWKYIE